MTGPEILTPDCPVCGTAGRSLVPDFLAGAVAPMMMCPNEDCNVWTWDPEADRQELLDNQVHDPELGLSPEPPD